MNRLLAITLLLTIFVNISVLAREPQPDIPAGSYWPLEKSQAIIEKTQTVVLTPDLSQLSESERAAVNKLLEAGEVFQRLYEQQRHAQALTARRALEQRARR